MFIHTKTNDFTTLSIVNLDLVKFVMCSLVSRDCAPLFKYIKRHVYPGNHITHDKLNQFCYFYSDSLIYDITLHVHAYMVLKGIRI